MARKKNEFLKAFGTGYEIFTKVSKAVLDNGGTDDDLRRILSDKNLSRRIAEMVIASRFDSGKITVSAFFPIVVDHGRTMTSMMTQMKVKDYSLHHRAPGMPQLSSLLNFNGVGRVEDEVAILEFEEWAAYEPEEVNDLLDKSGLEHTEAKHLFAFGERYPEMTFSYYIIAPGCDGGRCLANLVAMGSSIKLNPDDAAGYPYFGWDGIYCHRYLSLVFNMQMWQKPRLLVRRKQMV